jgi:putative addiction module component (TIGR02574 family)
MMNLMTLTLDQIVEETSHLPADVVAELVDRIVLARHGGIPTDIETDWKTEVHRRIEEIEAGEVQGVPIEESLARARKIIGR